MNSVSRTYLMGGETVHALAGARFRIYRGEFVAIIGASGSGKTSALNIMGLLDRPTSGRIEFNGVDVTRADDQARSYLRATKIGFVFQTFNLIPELSVLENAELPFLYSGAEKDVSRKKALTALEKVGLSGRINHLPAQLSGGEMQRAAIARAIAPSPDVLLADEPTGNLDSVAGAVVMRIFSRLHEEGSTIVMVTHDPGVARQAQRIIEMKDGFAAEA